MLPLVAGVTLLATGTAGGVFCHLRHFSLALLVLLAPLPGIAFVLPPFWALVGFRLVLLAYVTSLGVGLLLAGEFMLLVCEGAEREAAVRAVYRRRGVALGAGSLAMTLALALTGLMDQARPLALGAATLAVAANGSVVCVFYVARFLPCREDFVTRHNRSEERWHRLSNWLIAVAQPRWSHAVAGIALVFMALGVFGAQPLKIEWQLESGVWAMPLIALVVLAALAGAIRDWHAVLAAGLTLLIPILLGLWGLAVAGAALTVENLLLLLLAVSTGAASLFAAGTDAGRMSRAGDDATASAGRILQRDGRNLFFAGAIPALTLLLSAPATGAAGIALAIAAGAAVAGALLFLPAFAVVIEGWFPRVTTLASCYRLL